MEPTPTPANMSSSEDDELQLSSYYSDRATVEAWAIEPCPSSSGGNASPVDEEFVLNVYYDNQNIGSRRNMIFKLKSEDILMPKEAYNTQDVNPDMFDLPLVEWIDALGVEGDTAYRATLDVVLQGLEKMVREVRSKGRKSLAMMVEIEVLVLDIGGNEDDHMDSVVEEEDDEEVVDETVYRGELDVEEMVVDSGLEDEEALLDQNMIRDVLSGCGVEFISDCSMPELYGCPCSICLENFEESSTDQAVELSVLPCSHILHQHCLLSWISKGNSTCPLCRVDIDSCSSYVQSGDSEEPDH